MEKKSTEMLMCILPKAAMRTFMLTVAVFMTALGVQSAEPGIVRPFESGGEIVSENPIDALVLSALRERGIEPAKPCLSLIHISEPTRPY